MSLAYSYCVENYSTLINLLLKNIRGKKLIEELSISGKGNYLYIETSDQAKTKVNQMIMEQSVKN